MCASTDEPSWLRFSCARERPLFVPYVLRLLTFFFTLLGVTERSACMPSTFWALIEDDACRRGCLAFI
ncbi:unnamed protein product, partial [Ectocarpus sp. 12 AP-2014]